MKKILFSEEQKFTQSWITILIYVTAAVMLGLFTYGLAKQIIQGEPWGDNPMSDTGLILMTIFVYAIFIGLILFLHAAVLKTTITTEEVLYKFPPFFLKEKNIPVTDIQHAEVRQYNPIMEYGGWGVRIGIRKGKAYNVKGNIGIQLYLKSGKKILIGTQKKDKAEWAIRKLMENQI